MEGSVPSKVLRLGWHLLTRPRFLPRYLRLNLLSRRTPLDLELPWIAFAAIDFLEGHLEPGMIVGEYGAGGSTLFFARRVSRVVSVENNPQWAARVRGNLQAANLTHAEVVLRPVRGCAPGQFEEYTRALPAEVRFNVLLVDGPEQWPQLRPHCFRHAEERIGAGGVILLDDSWRYPELERNSRARRRETLRSVGPCRPGVTATTVFYY